MQDLWVGLGCDQRLGFDCKAKKLHLGRLRAAARLAKGLTPAPGPGPARGLVDPQWIIDIVTEGSFTTVA